MDNRSFQYAFLFTVHHKVKNHPERTSNLKPFLNLYNCTGIEYPTPINKNILEKNKFLNIYLKKKNSPEIILIVLYADVKLMISQFKGNECAKMHKPIKQSYVYKHYFEREKSCFIMNS